MKLCTFPGCRNSRGYLKRAEAGFDYCGAHKDTWPQNDPIPAVAAPADDPLEERFPAGWLLGLV